MRSDWLKCVSIGLGLALAGCAATGSDAPATASATPAATQQEAAVWPHAGSDVPADPAVRFGVLPNGMRYALLRNATPPGAGSLRLRIDAGSMHEREDQRGVAHFIEHLTLNETRNVPEGELIRILERAGLSFGPDTNAETGFEQTVYKLDLPRTDAQTVDTALFLMREVAGEATLRQEVIEGERGVILSEERTRATPQMRLVVDELGSLFPNDPLGNRLPIGATEVIRSAQRPQFVDFYDNYYRPERATLVAAGDFDLDALEAKIRERFGNWQGRGQPGADLPPLQVDRSQLETDVFVEAGVPTQLSVSWVAPRETAPDSRAVRREEILRQLGLDIFNRRIERLATGENPPLIGGAGVRARLADRADLTQLIGVAQAGGWDRALQTLEQEHRRAVLHGFTQAELDRAINDTRTRLQAAASGAATRTSPNLANALVGAVNEERVFASPATQLELFNQVSAGLQADTVSTAFRELFGDRPPVVRLSSPTPIENAAQALRTAFETSRQVAVAPPAAQQATVWPYGDFGAPGTVAERRELAQIGATAVRFANGVRLTVKPTQFRDDEVLVAARFAGGHLALPSDRPSAAWAIPLGALTGGGLGQITYEDMQQALTGKVYAADAAVAEEALVLSGRTRPEDLATQLEVLAAYARDPALRASAWDRLRALSGTLHDQYATSPGGVFQRDSGALLRSGDRRWETPSREAMAAMTVDALAEMARPALTGAPVEVIVVGDLTVDDAIRQVAATFGALPARPAPTAAAGPPVRFPAQGSVTRTHSGRADQALGFIAWPTPDFYANQRESRGLNLLSRVMQLRLLAQIREQQGTAYSPVAVHNASENAPGYGFLAALIEAPPAAMEGFFRDAQAIARSLREQPIAADELERARRPLVEAAQRSRNSSNQWWLSNLAGAHEQPRVAESIGNAVEQLSAITPAELQQLARRYLVENRAWRLAVVPEPGAGTQGQ